MIGYIKPFLKDLPRELKKEYRAVYCGLCHTLNKIGGLVGTSCLNYEATLILVVLLAIQEEEPKVFHGSCSHTPLLHVGFVDYLSQTFVNAACVSLVAAKLEVIDNLHDEKTLLWVAAERLLRRGAKRAEEELRGAVENVIYSVQNYYSLEQNADSDFGALLDASGEIFESMAAPLIMAVEDVPDAAELLLLTNALGKWTYLMDACDDWQEDKRRGCFNIVSKLNSISSMRDIVAHTEDCIKFHTLQLPVRRYHKLINALLIDNLKKVSFEILQKLEKEWQT